MFSSYQIFVRDTIHELNEQIVGLVLVVGERFHDGRYELLLHVGINRTVLIYIYIYNRFYKLNSIQHFKWISCL